MCIPFHRINESMNIVDHGQVALIVVLAQIGCFVPAQHATIPLRDRLLSRIGTSDDMEHNLSTFHTEMKERYVGEKWLGLGHFSCVD